MSRIFRGSLALAIICAAALAASSRAAPILPLDHSGRWITDATGRVVVVHGINMVYKLPPYYPSATGFDADDAAFLRSIGFNAVRVGVIWKALEPQPGVFDDSYLQHIADTVSTLASHGVMALLDFHQDLYNERFQGEGAPDWAVQDGGLPNPTLGFPLNYLGNLALEHALDAFFSNAKGPGGVGLEDRFAAAWAHVASYFSSYPSVLGYELFNEPFPGTLYEPCLLPIGCPGFDGRLTSLYHQVAHAIRAVDPGTMIWYEPNVLFNNGIVSDVGALDDPAAGFAFHDYCLTESVTGSPTGCDVFDNLVFENALKHVAGTHEAVMETEFGATNDTAYLDDMVARADQFMVPWLEWAYCGCEDPTTSGPGAKQAIVLDPHKPPTGSNLVAPTLHALVEPYPQVVAGTPRSWGYDRAMGTFTLTYSTARPGGGGDFPAGAETDVATPSLPYPDGYAADVSGAAIVSPPDAGELELAACPGTTSISLTVRGNGSSTGSCEAGLAVTVSPRRFKRGRRTAFRIAVLATLGSYRQPVAGATVTLGGRRARTNARGRATIRIATGKRSRYRATATAPGFIAGSAPIRRAAASHPRARWQARTRH
jgi:endoglycosylceramidase